MALGALAAILKVLGKGALTAGKAGGKGAIALGKGAKAGGTGLLKGGKFAGSQVKSGGGSVLDLLGFGGAGPDGGGGEGGLRSISGQVQDLKSTLGAPGAAGNNPFLQALNVGSGTPTSEGFGDLLGGLNSGGGGGGPEFQFQEALAAKGGPAGKSNSGILGQIFDRISGEGKQPGQNPLTGGFADFRQGAAEGAKEGTQDAVLQLVAEQFGGGGGGGLASPGAGGVGGIASARPGEPLVAAGTPDPDRTQRDDQFAARREQLLQEAIQQILLENPELLRGV